MSDFPDDIICAALFASEKDSIPTDMKKLHEAIYVLKKEFPDVYKEFTFSTSGTFPYSRLLERVLQRLITSRILKAPNPDYPKFELSEKSKDYIERTVVGRLKVQNPNLLSKISASGKRFAEIIE